MSPKIARLAGLGAFAACVVFVLLYALVAWGSRHTTLGGMTPAEAVVTWIAVGLVFIALIATHIVLGKQLIYLGKGGGPREV